jgi:hypothetical protein
VFRSGQGESVSLDPALPVPGGATARSIHPNPVPA